MKLAHDLRLGSNQGGYGRPYGVRFNFSAPPTTNAGRYDRLGSLSGYNNAGGALPWSAEIGARCTIQNRMRRCVMLDTIADPTNPQNSVAYYLHPANSLLKADGTVANVDGTDGNVMVEIPRFWQKVVYNPADPDVMEWWISPSPRAGFTLHPAFMKLIGGVAVSVPYRYAAAFEAVYREGETYFDGYSWTDGKIGELPTKHLRTSIVRKAFGAGSKIGSVAGKLPVTMGYRSDYRTASRAIDGNTDDSTWRQFDWNLWSAIQLLMLVEYASFNSQSALTGSATGGLANFPGGGTGWSATSEYYPVVPSGATLKLGNFSGISTIKDLSDIYSSEYYGEAGVKVSSTGSNEVFWNDRVPSYRGIENPFGHIFQWLDGVILDFASTARLDMYSSYGKFADDNPTADYRQILAHGGVDNAPASGYFTRIHEAIALDGFYGRAVGGSNITGLADYYTASSAAGKRVVAVGGASNYGGYAGVFYVYANYGSGNRYAFIGGRLCL